jgi:hypothetical protein
VLSRPLKVPRFLAPLARELRALERSIAKTLVLDSPNVRAVRQPNGRVQLFIKPRLRRPVVPTPVTTGFRILDDGGYRLLDDGGKRKIS